MPFRDTQWLLPAVAVMGAAALGLAVVATATASLAGGDSPADALDRPTVLDVNGDNEVLVGFWTDVVDLGMVRRYTPGGHLINGWSTRGLPKGIAAGPHAGVFVNFADRNEVGHFTAGGVPAARWTEDGLFPNLATGVLGRSLAASVYTIVDNSPVGTPLAASGASVPSGPLAPSQAAGGGQPAPRSRGQPPAPPAAEAPAQPTPYRRWILRTGDTGAEIARWPVDGSAFDLAAGPYAGAGEGIVYVADEKTTIAGTGHVVRYYPDGTRLDDWNLPGEVRGMDVNAAGQSFYALLPELSPSAYLYRYEQDGSSARLCELADVFPSDLAVAPSGEFYLVVTPREGIAAGSPAINPPVVLRLAPDCTVLGIWDPPFLVGVVTPTPPTISPSPTFTATSSPRATATVTPLPTINATATTPAGTPTAGAPAYLPAVLDRPGG